MFKVAILVMSLLYAVAADAAILDFDGQGDMVYFPSAAPVQLTAMTVECLVKFDRISTTNTGNTRAQELVNIGTDRDAGHFHLRQDWNNQSISFRLGNVDSPIDYFVTTDYALELDRWYHIAGTYDGTDMHLYIDGNPMGVYNGAVWTSDPTLPMSFGYHLIGYPWEYPFDGQMDFVALWDHARTPEQMAAGVDPNAAGLVGYWDFEEPLGEQTVTDLGPYAYNGQLGTTAFVDPADPARIASPSPIPEPSTLVIWSLLGALGIAYSWRRRRAA